MRKAEQPHLRLRLLARCDEEGTAIHTEPQSNRAVVFRPCFSAAPPLVLLEARRTSAKVVGHAKAACPNTLRWGLAQPILCNTVVLSSSNHAGRNRGSAATVFRRRGTPTGSIHLAPFS